MKAKEFRGRPGFRSLAEGEPLEFEIEENDDGKVCAVNATGRTAIRWGAPSPRRDDYGYDDDGYGGGYDDYGGGYGGGGRRPRRQRRPPRRARAQGRGQGRTITALKRAIEGGDDYPEELGGTDARPIW